MVQIPLEDLDGPLMAPPPTLEEHGYRLAIAPRLFADHVEVSTRERWLRVTLTGTNQRADGTEFFGVNDTLYPDNPPIENLAKGSETIKRG
jgi:hypothetical protein